MGRHEMGRVHRQQAPTNMKSRVAILLSSLSDDEVEGGSTISTARNLISSGTRLIHKPIRHIFRRAECAVDSRRQK